MLLCGPALALRSQQIQLCNPRVRTTLRCRALVEAGSGYVRVAVGARQACCAADENLLQEGHASVQLLPNCSNLNRGTQFKSPHSSVPIQGGQSDSSSGSSDCSRGSVVGGAYKHTRRRVIALDIIFEP